MEKDQRLELRLGQSEKQLLALAARAAGMPVSTFLRHEAIEAARKRLLGEEQ